jgi:fatty acid desaturase
MTVATTTIAIATIATIAAIQQGVVIRPVAIVVIQNDYLLLLNHLTLFSHIKHHKHRDQDCEQTNEPPHFY